MEAKRRAVDDLSGTDFEPGVAQNWAQFFVRENPEESKSLKRFGEPGRTRTSNPLIKSLVLLVYGGSHRIPFRSHSVSKPLIRNL
jgi:hypothetical protein